MVKYFGETLLVGNVTVTEFGNSDLLQPVITAKVGLASLPRGTHC